MKLVVQPRALADIREAAAWWAENAASLGPRFSLGLEAAFAQLARTPHIGRCVAIPDFLDRCGALPCRS